MKLLVVCFLGIVGTSAGTVFFRGALQHVCQTGFLIAAGVCVFL